MLLNLHGCSARSLEKLHIKYNANKHLMYYLKCFSTLKHISQIKTATYILIKKYQILIFFPNSKKKI